MSLEKRDQVVVLIADDEVNLLTLLQDNLEENGFKVITACDGEEAITKCTSDKPDAVILDVEMPKLNGWGVCKKIRQDQTFNYMPIILMLSAYVQPEDIKKGLSLGANKYITKPFKMKELIDYIKDQTKQLK